MRYNLNPTIKETDMDTYVLMIFAFLDNSTFSHPITPAMIIHSTYGFESSFACERAYDALAPTGYALHVNHTCEQVRLTQKIPDPLFVVPLVPRKEESPEPAPKKPKSRKSNPVSE